MATGNSAASSDIVRALATIAGALSTPSSSSSTSAASPSTNLGTTGNTNSSRSDNRDYNAVHVLPSFLKRRTKPGDVKRDKKSKVVKTWDRDVLCIPKSDTHATGNIKYPRRAYRAYLASHGLIGKLHLTSEMTDKDVEAEIRSIFRKPMQNNPEFPFAYLQGTGGGSNSLMVPSQSSSFKWTPQQVARLSGQAGIIYILAQDELYVEDPNENNSDIEAVEEDGIIQSISPPVSPPVSQPNEPVSPYLPPGPIRIQQNVHSLPTTPSNTTASSEGESSHCRLTSDSYREYVDLIDLTECVFSDDDNESEEPVVSADAASKVDDTKVEVDGIVIKHVIQQHQARAIQSRDDEDVQRIHIRRSCVFSDALRQFSKDSFDVSKMLQVRFVGEQAVDTGGPRREFFHLLLREIFTSSLFAGYPDHVVLNHNLEAVACKKFYMIGKMISTCVVQGGEAPVCFSKAVADFLTYDEVRSSVCLEDIPDLEIQDSLKKVQLASTIEEFKDLLKHEEFDFRFQCGYQKPTPSVTLEDKEMLIRCVWLHFVLYSPLAELKQLQKGLLETLQFKHLVDNYTKEVWGLLAASNMYEITSKFLCDSFVVQYSFNGSNNRIQEESIVFSWYEYISDCADRDDIRVGDVLYFLTGSSKVPATGFDSTPKIKFTDENRLPTVSTCELSITFPRKMAGLTVDEFKDQMDFCIRGSHGYGIP